MKVLNKLKCRKGYTLLETLITISIMSLALIPAYMAMMNGYEIFHDESTYQAVLSDVHLFYDELNTRVRISGFKESQLIDTQAELDVYPDVNAEYSGSNVHIFRVNGTFYYLEGNDLKKYNSGLETVLVESVASFQVTSFDEGKLFTINTEINVEGRQETIETSIYDRY